MPKGTVAEKVSSHVSVILILGTQLLFDSTSNAILSLTEFASGITPIIL